MNVSDLPDPPPGTIAVRAGCALSYVATRPMPIVLLFKPHGRGGHILHEEHMVFGNDMPVEEFADSHGNLLFRTTLVPGLNEYRHDAIYFVPDAPDNHALPVEPVPVGHLPSNVLRYTLPSRYCESDKLGYFAQEKFGHLPPGVEQVRAVCDWTHKNIEYRYGSGSTLISAFDTIERGYGVCRDFAHVMVALCRALDLPARYAAGHTPYLGVADGDIGIDFHAYCEVFLGGHWHTYDARYNRPLVGRIKIAHGMDAVDAAFSTIYGDAMPTNFQVWAYQVGRTDMRLDSPAAVPRDEDSAAALLAPA